MREREREWQLRFKIKDWLGAKLTLRSFKPSVLCEKERKNVLVKERERDNEKEKESKRYSIEMQKT